jgi:ribonucleoside-diphosphate reductase alpha chain
MRFEPSGLTDDPDIRIAQSVVDYIFRRLALDYLPTQTRAAMSIFTAAERARQLDIGSSASVEEDVDVESLRQSAPVEPHAVQPGSVDAAERAAKPAPPAARSSTELLEAHLGKTADAPLCFTCGTKMRPAGSCYVCEGCGSTSGCS